MCKVKIRPSKLLLNIKTRFRERTAVSQQILTESRNPTPISFASNSFASQDMLTDAYSSFPVAFLGSFCLILRNLSILVHRF